MWPFDRQPDGYTLVRADGVEHNKIRGDLIPAGTLVIVNDGRSFVATGDRDQNGFAIYREGERTCTYVSQGE